jgi:hypothetical protein
MRHASAPMILEDCEVAPDLQLTETAPASRQCGSRASAVQPGTSAVALGCRLRWRNVTAAISRARFEHLGQTSERALPTLRAQLAITMQIDTMGLQRALDDLVDHLECP